MKSSGIPLSALPKRYQEQVIATSRPKSCMELPSGVDAAIDLTPKKRLRQNASGLNKTEAAFLGVLKAKWPGVNPAIMAQAVTLVLGNGVRYTPDFVVALPEGFMCDYATEKTTPTCYKMLAFETKGFLRDDAAVKIKVAADRYPWIKFHLVTKRTRKQGGGWAIEEVLPLP